MFGWLSGRAGGSDESPYSREAIPRLYAPRAHDCPGSGGYIPAHALFAILAAIGWGGQRSRAYRIALCLCRSLAWAGQDSKSNGCTCMWCRQVLLSIPYFAWTLPYGLSSARYRRQEVGHFSSIISRMYAARSIPFFTDTLVQNSVAIFGLPPRSTSSNKTLSLLAVRIAVASKITCFRSSVMESPQFRFELR